MSIGFLGGNPPELDVPIIEFETPAGDTVDLYNESSLTARRFRPISPPSQVMISGSCGGARPWLTRVVVDIHNLPVAERFLADVIDGTPAVVDDDHGHLVDGAGYVAAVRARRRD